LTGASDARSVRLIIIDKESRIRYLIDTGADVSVLPKKLIKGKLVTSNFKLYAANNTPITTYGTKLVKLNLGLKRKLEWTFFIAEVKQPILGADFLARYGLVDLKRKKLHDLITKLEVSGKLLTTKVQEVTTFNSSNPLTDLLQKFKTITNPVSNMECKVKHNVAHYIVTTGPSIAEPARRLTGRKLETAKQQF